MAVNSHEHRWQQNPPRRSRLLIVAEGAQKAQHRSEPLCDFILGPPGFLRVSGTTIIRQYRAAHQITESRRDIGEWTFRSSIELLAPAIDMSTVFKVFSEDIVSRSIFLQELQIRRRYRRVQSRRGR